MKLVAETGVDPCLGGAECNVVCDEGNDDCFDADGTGCTDDTLFCTGPEECDGAGSCASTGDPCSVGQSCDEAAGGQCLILGCQSDSDCNDNNKCTNDNCNTSDGSCSTTNKAVGAACDDDGDPLTDDFCEHGTCVHPLFDDGTPPDDNTNVNDNVDDNVNDNVDDNVNDNVDDNINDNVDDNINDNDNVDDNANDNTGDVDLSDPSNICGLFGVATLPLMFFMLMGWRFRLLPRPR